MKQCKWSAGSEDWTDDYRLQRPKLIWQGVSSRSADLDDHEGEALRLAKLVLVGGRHRPVDCGAEHIRSGAAKLGS